MSEHEEPVVTAWFEGNEPDWWKEHLMLSRLNDELVGAEIEAMRGRLRQIVFRKRELKPGCHIDPRTLRAAGLTPGDLP